MNYAYRPSGPLRWAIAKLPTCNSWDVIGALAAEPRANEVVTELELLGKLRSAQLLHIIDEPSEFQLLSQKACKKNRDALSCKLSSELQVFDAELFFDVDELEAIFSKLESSIGASVILDITSLPKRFFFYLVRRLRSSAAVQNLLVTYAIPLGYGKKMHKNPGGWMPLPSFGSEESISSKPMLVISVGFHHLKLFELIRDRTPKPVRLIMPFPSMPPGFAQNWEFVRYIHEQGVELHARDVRRVDPYSLSLAFDHLRSQCTGHDTELILAPFGPKPISLAMALYALTREDAGLPVTVGYTQPIAYSNEYSHAVRHDVNGNPVVHAYCVKLSGNLIYKI